MANKKVSQLVAKPSVLVTDLFPIADPTTGQLFKTTISDLGTAIGSGVSSVNTLVGAVVLDTDDIQELASPTNRWFTDTRARAALSASSPLTYNSGTGVFSLPQANGSTNGFLSSADWTTFNAKQAALSGTGFVKISGTTISYDNSTYLTTSAAASTYLALAGGTLTGAVTGTRLSLSQNSADITLSIGNAGTGRAFSVLGTSYFSTDIQLGYATNAILKTTALGFITSAIAGTDYQAPLSGTGFVKISGSTISYDNSTYALDSAVVKLTGTQTVAGVKTMSNVFKLDDTLQIKNIAQLSNSTGYTGIWAETAAIGFYTGANAIRLLYAGNYNYTMPASDGTLALTSQLSAYLPLAGGTLTGALNGTSALFSGAVRANNPSEGATGEGLIAGQSFKIDGTGTSQKAVMYMVSNVLSDTYASGLTAQYANFAGDKAFGFNLNTSGGFELYVKNTTFNKAITVANTGAVTLTGALSGTSATFSGNVTIRPSTGYNAYFQTSGTSVRINYLNDALSANVGAAFRATDYSFQDGSGGAILTLASTGAATFSSSVTAGAIISTGVSTFSRTGLVFTLNPSYAGGDVYTQLQSTGALSLASGGDNNRLYITSSGNVGIGTTSPSGASGLALAINGGTNQTRIALKNSTTGDAAGNGLQILLDAGSLDAAIENRENGHLRFATGGSERMRITSSGNVNITNGTITTGVSISIAAINTAYVLKSGAYSGLVVIRDNTNGGSGVWIVDPNYGNILIANNMPGTFTIAWNGTNTTITKTSGNAINISVGFYSNILG